MSLKVASKRLQTIEVSALQQAGQIMDQFVGLLTDSELERLVEVQASGEQATGNAYWQELLSLSPERKELGLRLSRLSWIFDMSKAISER